MAISKEEKIRRVALYKENLSKSQGVIFTDYRGMDTAQLTKLRRQIKEVGGTYMVVKNTLFRIALRDLDLPVAEEIFKGPVAVGFGFEDLAQVAKKIVDFAKEEGLPVVKGGMMGEQLLEPEQIKELAKLPPREVLLAQVIGGIQAPIAGLVGVLSGVLRSLVYVLNARVQQLEGQQAS